MSAAVLVASFGVLLAGALLFTNAVEWLGHRLGLGQGAVGSLLAAVATALPESIIPVVAIVSGTNGDDVAIGAIVGAPFMLATVAMALVGVSAFAFQRTRPQGRAIDAHLETLGRDLRFFLVFFALAFGLGLGAPRPVRGAGALVLVVAYGLYVRSTLRRPGAVQGIGTLKPLIIGNTDTTPGLPLIATQLLVALSAIIGGAHLFVHELVSVARHVGVEPLILALVLAPLATELPEKANSFFWTRDGKDTLALGNITGAMVFQSTLPVALGLLFTGWDLTGASIAAATLGLGGGALAVWVLENRRRFDIPAIAVWGALYAAFVVYVGMTL